MAACSGSGGKVMVSSDTVAFVESWDLDISDEALETTGLGASARTFIGRGLPALGGSLTFRALDNSDTATAALRAAVLAGTSVALKLYESATKYWGGDAIVTGYKQTTNVDGLVTGSIDFQCTGSWSYN